MWTFKVLAALSIVCLVAGDNQIAPAPNSTLPTSTTSSTTPKPSPTTTTTTKTTTPKPTTTASTTSTTKTTTTSTTSTQKTTTAPPTTSTAKPTTSTAPTTVKPTTPAPVDPVQGKWVVNYTNTNRTCLLLEAALQIDIPYQDANTTKTYKVNVPPTAKAVGDCASQEKITLFFNQPQNFISFTFNKTNDTKKYDLASVLLTVNVTIPGKNISQLVNLTHNKQEFLTPLSNSYKCAKEQTLNLTDVLPSLNEVKGFLRISHLQVQAFRNSTNAKFDEALDCEGSETPDVVPIAVGCALALLVIIVLVAYLIGRRRSQARGYLSM